MLVYEIDKYTYSVWISPVYSDYSLFAYSSGSIFLCVLGYMDDLIITGNHFPSLQKFKTHLNTCFHMKDLDPLKYFLGTEVARTKQGT